MYSALSLLALVASVVSLPISESPDGPMLSQRQTPQNGVFVGAGTYRLQVASSAAVADLRHENPGAYDNTVVANQLNAGSSEQWKVQPVPGVGWTIQNVLTGWYLAAPGTMAGSPIVAYTSSQPYYWIIQPGMWEFQYLLQSSTGGYLTQTSSSYPNAAVELIPSLTKDYTDSSWEFYSGPVN